MIDSTQPTWQPGVRQPIFNVPRVVIWLAGTLFVVHALRAFLLSDQGDAWVISAFAFIPLRVSAPDSVQVLLPGGSAARVWSFVTYALLHGGWGHLLINGVWMAAFGSAVAWRFGTGRFLLLSAVGAVAGAAVHWLVYPQSFVPMVGASAAISAHMAAASRFVFSTGGPMWGPGEIGRYRRPAPSLVEVITDRRVFVFLAVWFAINLLFGLGGTGAGLASGAVAWDAHIGGFVAGLLLFPLFDPIGTDRR